MAKQEEDTTASKPAPPPYLSALTFQNAINFMSDNGLPAQVDRGVLSKFSGNDQRSLFHALRYLGFTDSTDKPTARFREYEAADAESRKGIIGKVLVERYPNQAKLLKDGTPQQLQASFGEYAIENSVRQKCISFFLKLSKEAGFQMSNYIAKSIRATGPRKGGKAKAKPAPTDEVAETKKKKDPDSENKKDPPDDKLKPGMVMMPIALGPNKTWEIRVDEKFEAKDAARFIMVAKIVLGVP